MLLFQNKTDQLDRTERLATAFISSGAEYGHRPGYTRLPAATPYLIPWASKTGNRFLLSTNCKLPEDAADSATNCNSKSSQPSLENRFKNHTSLSDKEQN
jgi:hypothetical protein